MFRDLPIKGLHPLFRSLGSDPLANWEVNAGYGNVCFIQDEDLRSRVLDIYSVNTSVCCINCPTNNRWLGIRKPFLSIILKNMHRNFSFEVTVIDSVGMRRRFRLSTFQSKLSVSALSVAAPLSLNPGWNKLIINLDDYTFRAYGTKFVELGRIQINANIRIRYVYFADKLFDEEDLPPEYVLFPPKITKITYRNEQKRDPLKKKRDNIKNKKKLIVPSNTPRAEK